MTTPNTVSLPTSPEVQERLFAAGWTFEDTWPSPCWRKPNGAIVTLRLNGTWVAQGSPADIVEFAAILGIYQSPPGMVLVPVDVVQRALPSLKHYAELRLKVGRFMRDGYTKVTKEKRLSIRRPLSEVTRALYEGRVLTDLAAALSQEKGAPTLEVEASKTGFMLNQGAANLWRNPACDASPSAYPSVPAPPGAPLKGDGER